MTRLLMPRRAFAAALSALVVALSSLPSGAVPRSSPFAKGGLRGSGQAVMQVVTVPARPGRVASVPGTSDVWAIGHISAAVPGWDARDPNGQVVFLRLVSGTWRVVGPPLDERGRVINPLLFSFAFAGNGEGWAVGEGGVLLRKAPGSTKWVESPQSRSVTTEQIVSISLSASKGAATGFAVGESATVMRLVGGSWALDPSGTDMADGPDLTAVSALSSSDAWAVTGSTSADLRIFRRTTAGWSRVLTGERVFDGPHPTDSPGAGTTVSAAFGASIAATASGAWVGGMILPQSASTPFGDPNGENSRPFVIGIADGTATSYCPDYYGVRQRASGVEVDQTAICDRPFPSSLFDITSLAVFPGNEVFAAGLGLFHLKDGGWFREPNANGYIASMAMLSKSEGWFATTGNTYGAGGAVHSAENTLGHYTRAPAVSRVARWPIPHRIPLESVALQPGGSKRALAVGGEGWSALFEPGAGWDTAGRASTAALHAVAWSDPSEAWAVGETGTVQRWDGAAWHQTPKRTPQSLFSVAFRGPRDGVAVGGAGTILRYDGSAWSRDPASARLTRETLYAVIATRGGYTAVGASGTVIEHAAGAWKVRAETPALLKSGNRRASTLFAVTEAPDGSLYAAGTGGSIIHRSPAGAYSVFRDPLQGTVAALAADLDRAGSVRLYASLSPDPAKYRGDRLSVMRSVLMVHEKGVWRDVSVSRRRSLYPSLEQGAFQDPIFSLALDSPGVAWGVGGIPAQTPDGEQQHLRSLSTSSVYRIDLELDPTFPAAEAEVELPKTGFNFAVFGESWCARVFCSTALGTGTQADLVALQIQDEVRRASRLANGVKFAMFAGNGRVIGLPEELMQFKHYLSGFSVPVFGAVGDRDLVNNVNSAAAQDVLASARVSTGSNDYWKAGFADRAAPWGEGAGIAGFAPVSIPGEAQPISGLARTHYAFDYTPAGTPLARLIVLDSSTRSYGRSYEQNPEESQGSWLDQVLIDAKGLNSAQAIPSIIVMNQPTVLPDRTQLPNWVTPSDKSAFENSVVLNSVSAVFAGGARMNISGGFPDADVATVPLYVIGGGGGPLGFEPPSPTAFPTKLPSDGFYNAWFLVNVGEKSVLPTGSAVAPVTVKAFPVLESLAIHALDGRSGAGGNTMQFSALARALNGGFSDPDQSKTTYYAFGADSLPGCGGHGPGNGTCQSEDAILPEYRFYSENPEVADFVQPNYSIGRNVPLLDGNGNPVRDPLGTTGLLCTFKAGEAAINVVSGFKKARMVIKVGAGFGPCVKKPVVAPNIIVKPPAPERPVPAREVPPDRFFPRKVDSVGVILPPPPAPVVAPAPPGAPGVGRKEEHEVQFEKEGDSEGHRHAFVPVRHRVRAEEQPWVALGSLALLAFFGATVAAGVRRRAVSPAPSRRQA